MTKVEGKIRNILYQSDNGYTVALFRVKKCFDDELKDFLNKTITITGNFINPNQEDKYILEGIYKEHPRYGFQLQVSNYDKAKPSDEDAVIEFLSSSLIKGCGEKTAKLIVESLGVDAIDIIKSDPKKLEGIKGLKETTINKIYSSLCAYSKADETLLYLKKLGFSVSDCSLIYSKYGDASKDVLDDNFYILLNIMDFKKIDTIYVNNYDKNSDIRVLACIKESILELDIITGNTYHDINNVFEYFINKFKINITNELFNKYLKSLHKKEEVYMENNNVYSIELHDDEDYITSKLSAILKHGVKLKAKVSDIDEYSKNININYNADQKSAIRSALENPISIISGGPGVGKTTIINAIVQLYMDENRLTSLDALAKIALLAPTGRAAKKLATSTKLPAQTIHRYLKWNKESDDFQVNEYNPNLQNLIIVDEVSMLDTHLFSSLLKGITSHVKLVLVGDVYQLPSVGPGQILKDLIESEKIPYVFLKDIYRQSENSYIPYLAKDIKEKNITDNVFNRKDDYTFIDCEIMNIKALIKKICEISKNKGINEEDIQILAPMYKGENGIDNLNYIMQDYFNPRDENKKEITYGYVVYRENDKVLQQINNPDCNVYNGDIGYIKKIESITKPEKKDIITINFDGNYVEYTKEDLSMIKHAYAITIHKSQGSEFPHVIIPVCHSYNKMLYNKLIYTGVSRAKKSLIVLGEKESYINAINNDYSNNRKTSLKEKIMNNL